MVYGLLTINALVMLIAPLALGIWLASRWRAPWRLFGVGAVTFFLAQVGHIPFNQWVLNPLLPEPQGFGRILLSAVLLGLSAGLFEESARYLVYRFWLREARTWRDGMMFGAGHGGLEAIILGLLALVGVFNTYLIVSGQAAQMVGPGQAEQLSAAEAQIAAILSLPRYNLLLGGAERLFALVTHLALALLVLQVLVRGNHWWLGAAVGWHTLLNAVAVVGAFSGWTPLAIEGALGLLALGSLAIIRALYNPPTPPGADIDANDA